MTRVWGGGTANMPTTGFNTALPMIRLQRPKDTHKHGYYGGGERVGEDVGKPEPLCTTGGNVKWGSRCGKVLAHDPAVPLLGIHPREGRLQQRFVDHTLSSSVHNNQRMEATQVSMNE